MKAGTILAVVLMAIAGSARAADFAGLQAFKASTIKAADISSVVPENTAPVKAENREALGKSEYPPYRTFCSIQNGLAMGHIKVDGSMSFAGTVRYYFYDMSGAEVSNTWTIAVVVVVGSGEIGSVSAPSGSAFCSVDISEALNKKAPAALLGISKGYVAGNDPSAVTPSKPIEWVTINGVKFTMGTDSGEKGFEDAKPIHEVAIKSFDMSKTAVTVEQYAECVIKGGCTEPATGDYCNWGVEGRQLHPINCVDWDQASKYAKFKGGRLPSEAEFEYAATSGGKNQKYPWGNDEPTCDKAVMYGNGGYGCGKNSAMPVCSKTAGNTAYGLCDMAGNVWQWVQDKYQDSYKGAPVDGSAFEAAGSYRVMRGGSFNVSGASSLRADYRYYSGPGNRHGGLGFRLAR